MDFSRIDRNSTRNKRHFDDVRRQRRSRSRSRERHHHRSRSPGKSYRPISRSPPSMKRDDQDKDIMEASYYQNSSYRDGYGLRETTSSFMNPNVRMPPTPVQYPVNHMSSVGPYARYPGYEHPPMFNSGPQPHSFQQQMPQSFVYPQTQNYQGYNSMGVPENPLNPYPLSRNQSMPGFDRNFTNLNTSKTAVMYPHLKIGQSRLESYGRNESPRSSSPLNKRSKSSEKRTCSSRSKSPDSRKHKKKLSKRHSKSPISNRKYDDRDIRYAKHSSSPSSHRFESKKPKVIIDPNRIPTPPPPPIVGSYDKESPRNEKAKAPDSRSIDSNTFSDFLSKDKVSLSCLLEAVMENSGQGKSQLSDPKVKRDIISKCESKIRHLYKRRMSGLGAFIPDPVQPSRVIEHVSPLIASCSLFTFNSEEETSVWHCPGIIIPKVKVKEKKCYEKAIVSDFDNDRRFESENPTVIPTLIVETKQNWNSNTHQHPSQQKACKATNENVSQVYQAAPQNWYNPVPQSSYNTLPVSSHGSEIPTLGPPCLPPTFPYHPSSAVDFAQPQQGYEMNYPTRMLYPPQQSLPPKNFDHPGNYIPQQCTQIRNDYNHFNVEEVNKPKKNNKNTVNNNLILLNNLGSHKNEKVSSRIDLTKENDLKRDLSENIKFDDGNKMPKGLNEAKDKLMRKLWQLRKSSDYVPVPVEQQSSKEQEDDIYNNLNYAEMNEDPQFDTLHDYQLTNLRERVEMCLAEGKVSPEYLVNRNKEKRDDRERVKDRHREKDKARDRERARERERFYRDLIDDDLKRHGKSPVGDDRKKFRSSEVPVDREHGRTRSREPSSQLTDKSDDIIEISDEDHNKQIEKEEPGERTLTNQIFDLLGPEIRKTQEKSDLYKSIIASLDSGDRSYKRLYSFKNTALTKADKDNKMKMVVPRDNLKEIVVAIHKNFHHVQSEELSRLLRDLIFPNMTHVSKCINKVMSECLICIEQKKQNEKKEELIEDLLLKDKKIDKKPDKRIDRSIRSRDKERDRRNSNDRDRRFSKDRRSSSSSRGVRRDPPRSGRKRDLKDKNFSKNDGRPPGYEKAIKVKKPAPATPKSDIEELSLKTKEEKSEVPLVEENVSSVEVSHELSDKALEFKQSLETNIEESGKVFGAENFCKQQAATKNDHQSDDASPQMFADELNKNNAENQNEEIEKEIPSSAEVENLDNKDIVCATSKSLSDHSVVITINESVKFPDISLNIVTEENEKCNLSTEEFLENSNKNEIKEKCNALSEEVTENFNKKEENKKCIVSTEEFEEHYNKTEENEKCIVPREKFKENIIIEQDKISTDTKTDIVSKEANSLSETNPNAIVAEKAVGPKLDFKGRVRQVQLRSNECKDVISALESGGDDKPVDSSYLMKGGMLCKKTTAGNTTEIKIVAPNDQLEEVANIVHTMSVIHTPSAKVVGFFSKHFTQVNDLDSKVNEFINKCSICKIKSS